MNAKSVISLQRALILALFVGSFFFTITAIADPTSNASGELLVAKEVTLDDAPASAGLTVLSGSRIKTGLGGQVTVNLSKLGRVTLGPDTEAVLTFSEGVVGGELLSGWMVISAPKGVRISHMTADGAVIADGSLSSLLTIDVTSGNTRVESSGASVLSGNKREVVVAGEELEFSRPAGNLSRNENPVITRRPIAASESGIAPRSATEASGLTSLLTTVVRGAVEGITLNHSQAASLIGRNGDRNLDRTIRQANSPDYMRLSIAQQPPTTCGEFNELCANCSIKPDLIFARPKCLTAFVVKLNNVNATSLVSVRPFFNSACFRISPTFPQQVQIPPGGSYPFQISARFCPNNAGQLPQNSQIVIETSTCGKRNVQVAWGIPCR